MNNPIYHLSHIDLDGYSCQLVMSYTPYTIYSYNANYGAEVMNRLEQIVESITRKKENATILISDLNLTLDESKWLQKKSDLLSEKGITVTLNLLDHHGSGESSAKKYAWYYLDVSRCATKIVYDYAKEHYNLDEPEWLESFVNVVNAVDLWKQEEHENFEYGKVCMRLITETRELNRVIFSNEDREYKLTLLKEAASMMDPQNAIDATIHLDASIHKMKKEFFKKDHDNTLDNLITKHIVQLFGGKRSEMTIYYKGYKGFLSYATGNTSIIGNGFLVTYPEYDFIVDVSPRGTMSLRANNQVSVSQIAKEWAKGGGHPNAAGGRIQGFKEQYRYDKVKEQIEHMIADRESKAGDLEYKKEETTESAI
jgi:oligoribonuclease NrnB/cAMP/cGMP phosphodiesterase (DHH superfamily)